jgi:hypothetical protein
MILEFGMGRHGHFALGALNSSRRGIVQRFRFVILLGLLTRTLASAGFASESASPDPRYTLGELLASDDFTDGIERWRPELEKAGRVVAQGGVLEIDVPGGCSVWWKTELNGPLMISYEATMVDADGPNDRVSDLNCFWMAQDARSPNGLFGTQRTGHFSDYDQLRCYYVGHGGNSNTTTRFRRYIGEKGNRPLRPEHDLTDTRYMLKPNTPVMVQLIAVGNEIGYYINGDPWFKYHDPQPYTRGWFAFRTVTSHFKVKNFRVHRLLSQ